MLDLIIALVSSGSGFVALALLMFYVVQLIVLVGLWNMRARALGWMYIFLGIGVIGSLVANNPLEAIILLIIIGYLMSVADKFD